MINNARIMFCDNEHGTGDVCFPDIDKMDSFDIKQVLIKGNTTKELRKEAKKEGWGCVNGGDYCPACMESGI
jgi:hypothetical protein